MMRCLSLLALTPFLCGFVLLSPDKATLEVTPEAPEVVFIWNGQTPEIDAKDEYRGGNFQDLSDEDFFAQLLQDAMDVWNEVPGSYVVMTLAEGDAKADKEDGQHSIVVDSVNLSSSAFALPKNDEEDPKIIRDCDITISSKKSKARSLAFTIAHELGHCLGLGHSHSNYAAMMSYSRTSYALNLGADDIAGLIYLYPDPNFVSEEPQEMFACGTVAGRDFGANVFLLIALLLPVAWAGMRTAPAKAPGCPARFFQRRTRDFGKTETRG